MRRRPSARVPILDHDGALLLFRFVQRAGALVGQDYRATPGGALEPGETFAEAAMRALHEETGVVVTGVGDPIASREFEPQMPMASASSPTSASSFASASRRSLATAGPRWKSRRWPTRRWWTPAALVVTSDIAWPDLHAMLGATGYR